MSLEGGSKLPTTNYNKVEGKEHAPEDLRLMQTFIKKAVEEGVPADLISDEMLADAISDRESKEAPGSWQYEVQETLRHYYFMLFDSVETGKPIDPSVTDTAIKQLKEAAASR